MNVQPDVQIERRNEPKNFEVVDLSEKARRRRKNMRDFCSKSRLDWRRKKNLFSFFGLKFLVASIHNIFRLYFFQFCKLLKNLMIIIYLYIRKQYIDI